MNDGLFEPFNRPAVVLGQQVSPLPAGVLGLRTGPAFTAWDAVRIVLHGKGAHGSRPEASVDPGQATGSEDVGLLVRAAEVPCCYWLLGDADPSAFAQASKLEDYERIARELPSNHSPFFAPVIEPTLGTGVAALVTAARTWLPLPG